MGNQVKTLRLTAAMVLVFIVALNIFALQGCVATTPAGSLESTEPHINVKVQRGDHITEISFQGDTVLAEEQMMFKVIDRLQEIHIQNIQNDQNSKGK